MIPDRHTIQGDKVYEYLSSVDTHPTAEEVHHAVRKEIPTISLATVYRNLDKLVRQGKAIKFSIDNESHYDADLSEHQHFVCEACGNIMDIHDADVSHYAMKKARDLSPSSVTVIYHGKCQGCKDV